MDEMLLTPEERHKIADSIPVEDYATSIQYWDAIILAELEAQLSKVKEHIYTIANYDREIACYEKGEKAGQEAERERIADWLSTQGAAWTSKNYAIIEAIRKGQAQKEGG